MHLSDLAAPELLTLIGAVTAAIVAIINAIGSYWGRKDARSGRQRAEAAVDQAHSKLDVIATQTNGRYDDIVKRLTEAELQLALLKQPKP